MEIDIGMSECDKNVDNYYGSHITVWIPRCAGREAFDGVEPLHGWIFDPLNCIWTAEKTFSADYPENLIVAKYIVRKLMKVLKKSELRHLFNLCLP